MISINNLSYLIGDRVLYEDASIHIKPNDKIGLIGANGTGKTTFLRLITGDYPPSEGTINKSKDCTIGYLNQDLLSYESEKTILDVTLEAFEEAQKLKHEIDDILKKLETEYTDELVTSLTDKQEKFEALDGYTHQSQAEEILEGLGFKTAQLTVPLSEFSGGWRMRVMLAKILLAKPSLLLLDEPTNHLDLPSIEWLEKYIKNYDGAIIIVSHDRYFLDNCITKIVEIAHQMFNQYSGNYSFYLEEKVLREEIQHNAYVNQQKKIQETEAFITKFKAKATKAKQAQSRLKTLNKLDRLEDTAQDAAVMKFRFDVKKQAGKVICQLNNITKSYGDNLIFTPSEGVIKNGDKIALIGANGKGKSTLLRMVSEEESPDDGTVEVGHNVHKGFFAQHQLEALNLKSSLLEELSYISGSNKTELELRSLLGAFLFTNDDVDKKISVLSGGEKSRVALAKTLIEGANFLLLDEPTNHLDIKSVGSLIKALVDYQGTFITVSHDRHFIKSVANKIWFIENHELKEYPGSYDEFMHWMQKRKIQNSPSEKKIKKENTKPRNDNNFKQSEKETKKLKNSLSKAEKDVETLEKQILDSNSELAKPEVYNDSEALQKQTAILKNQKEALAKTEKEWEAVALKIDQIESV